MKRVPIALALALVLAAALPLAGAGRDCSKMTEAQVYAKSSKVLYAGDAPKAYKVCVCDAEPVIEIMADGKTVAVVQGGQCADVTGTKIEVHAPEDRGVTIGYTPLATAR